MTQISKDQVMNIADVVKLALSDEEVEQMTEHLRSYMKFIDKLNELNTEDIPATTHVFLDQTVTLRRDEARLELSQEEVLENAPEHQDGHFKVPSILD